MQAWPERTVLTLVTVDAINKAEEHTGVSDNARGHGANNTGAREEGTEG